MERIAHSQECASAHWVTSDKTHIEHNETALILIADMPRDMDFCCNGPEADACTAPIVPIRSRAEGAKCRKGLCGSGHSGKFKLKLITAWIAMGFRRPEITLGTTVRRAQ